MVSPQRAPVMVFLHGGWWKSQYSLDYGGHLCAALLADGIASWSIEYRRVGEPGGGWPGTFADVAAGYDFLANLAQIYPLDLARIVVLGHSAGGHLAFWLAGRPQIEPASCLHMPQPSIFMRAVLAVAGAVDLRHLLEPGAPADLVPHHAEILRLMGGSAVEVPERYRAGDPGDLLPFHVPQVLLQGTHDDQIPSELPQIWAERARARGDQVEVEMIAGADHYDLIDPQSAAWSRVRAAVHKALP